MDVLSKSITPVFTGNQEVGPQLLIKSMGMEGCSGRSKKPAWIAPV